MNCPTIRPATIADKDAIFEVHYEALKRYHGFYAAFYTSHPKEFMYALTDRALKNPNHKFLVAELEGSVAGFIRYTIEAASQSADGVQDNENKKVQENQQTPPPLVATKDHLKDMWERFSAREAEMDACKEKAIKGQPHYYVWHLMIHPNHQRKGIGKKLLQSVTEKADAEGVPTMIVSSAESHGLYLKAGFEDLGEWTIDNGYWAREVVEYERSIGITQNEGLESQYNGVMEVEACMIRHPTR